jgi:hypothetical protein
MGTDPIRLVCLKCDTVYEITIHAYSQIEAMCAIQGKSYYGDKLDPICLRSCRFCNDKPQSVLTDEEVDRVNSVKLKSTTLPYSVWKGCPEEGVDTWNVPLRRSG